MLALGPGAQHGDSQALQELDGAGYLVDLFCKESPRSSYESFPKHKGQLPVDSLPRQSDLKGAETRCSTCVCYDKGRSPRAFFLNFCTGKTGMVRTPLIPLLESQRQIDLCKYKASLVYVLSSQLARATRRDRVSLSQKKKKY